MVREPLCECLHKAHNAFVVLRYSWLSLHKEHVGLAEVCISHLLKYQVRAILSFSEQIQTNTLLLFRISLLPQRLARCGFNSMSSPDKIDDFSISPFCATEDVSNIQLGDLSNDIHPIFARCNWATDIDYAALEPSLRLASLPITKRCLLRFWHTLFHGEEERFGNGRGFWFDDWEHIGEDDETFVAKAGELNDTDVADKLSALEKMASMVRFDCRRDPSCSLTASGSTWADMEYELMDPPPSGNLNRYPVSHLFTFPDGNNSRIYMDPEAYQRLRAYTAVHNAAKSGRYISKKDKRDLKFASIKPRYDPAHLIYLQYDFARTVCHEIAHAAWNAIFDDVEEEPFNHGLLAECGFEWESHVFGGTDVKLDSKKVYYRYMEQQDSKGRVKRSNIPRLFANLEWPSASLWDHYRVKDLPMSIVQETQGTCDDGLPFPEFWQPVKLKSLDTCWRYSVSWIQKLFTQAFWDVEVEQLGAIALRIPRQIGYRFVVPGNGSLGRGFNDDDTTCVPDDCEVASDGTLRPIAHWAEFDGFGRLCNLDVPGIVGSDA